MRRHVGDDLLAQLVGGFVCNRPRSGERTALASAKRTGAGDGVDGRRCTNQALNIAADERMPYDASAVR